MPRLSGVSLQMAHQLTRLPWVASLLRMVVTRDLGLNDLMDIIPGETELLLSPVPLQAAPPRQWSDAEHGAPSAARGSGAELRAAYAAKQTDPREVLERLIARTVAGRFGLSTHSPFICADWERARIQADASRTRYASGSPVGALDGIPVPIKDNLDIMNLPTRVGTSYRNTPAKEDCFAVKALVKSGALLAGKTHATEWLMNGWGMNPHFDMPRNVWSADHGAGGSSTGSAVAVALGLVPVSIGSDGGGSIRIPAAINGIFGLKPTFVRISRTGDLLRACSMCHTGPLGRSTEDLVDLMEAIGCVADPDDPLTQVGPIGPSVTSEWRAALGRGVKGCRLGVVRTEWEEAHPSYAQACLDALAALEAEGAVLVDVELPLAKYAPAIGGMNLVPEILAALHQDRVHHRKDIGAENLMLLNIVNQLTLHQYLMLRRARTAIRRQVQSVLKDVDLLVLPTLMGPPSPYSLTEGRKDLSDFDANLDSTRLTIMSNITGLPAGSAPIGFHNGFPVGIQIVGDAWDEASVFAVMAHLERIGIARIDQCPEFEALV